MNESEKFLRMFGGIFFSIGIFIIATGITLIIITHIWFVGAIPLFIGIVFGAIGGGILIVQSKHATERKKIIKEGVRYTGKIYGYVEDRSSTLNGAYTMNTKVHYFDKNGIEREAIIPTGFARGAGDFPIGATIDIIALGASYTWVQGSVRYERIDREDELMDDKPINVGALEMTAVRCPNCGASYAAAVGYVGKCPYCGSAVNV